MSVNGEANPLHEITFQIPFDRIRAEHVEPAVRELLADAQARLEAIANEQAPRSFDNTMGALDRMTERPDFAMSVVKHLESVATHPELRTAYNAVQPLASAFYSGIPLHDGLWKAVQHYAGTSEAGALTGTRKRFLTKTMEDFRRHGAELDPAGKARLEALDVELSKITTKFAENVLDIASRSADIEVRRSIGPGKQISHAKLLLGSAIVKMHSRSRSQRAGFDLVQERRPRAIASAVMAIASVCFMLLRVRGERRPSVRGTFYAKDPVGLSAYLPVGP